MSAQSVLEVDRLSKRFTRDHRRSRRYAAADILRELAGRSGPPGGRPLRAGEFDALDQVSFTLERGDSLAVIGANGAGKSTLLKLLYGLIKPDGGEVRIRGRVSALIELGTGFEPILTGRENIAVNGAILGLSEAQLREATDQIVAFAELEHAIDSPVRTYSSGMSARLAFSIAAHVQPDVLLIDEVFAVGDHAFQRKCMRHMQSFLDRGGSLIIVSHNVHQIQSTCRRGLLLEDGCCTFAGGAIETLSRYLAIRTEAVSALAGRTQEPVAAVPVIIDAVTVRPVAGTAVQTGKPLRVEIAYRSLAAVSVIWGFNVWTADGWVCVTGAYDMQTTRLRADAGSLSCIIPRLPLLTGHYTLRVTILDEATRQVLALHGYGEAPVGFDVQSPATADHNGGVAMSQLVTVDVDWD